MRCDEAQFLLHALLDRELDAGHSSEVEVHLADCPRCTAQLHAYRDLRQMMLSAELRFVAPPRLRHRIDNALPTSRAPNRRTLLQGFALGAAASAIAASGMVVVIQRADWDQRILDEIISAHLRSLQVGHLTDVQTSDQHTVKPWFNGKLDAAPPVFDLATQGFTLLGGRLDYIDGRAIASIVYQRRAHVINLFIAPVAKPERTPGLVSERGFNIWRWTEQGLSFWAVSDINADELQEFGNRLEAAILSGKT
ncbi:MAG: anti-sigma factor [Xanthobacteraceae bacterium]|nr:MAG: anti-sigma factor [Xanthobacteraceae bacterium]